MADEKKMHNLLGRYFDKKENAAPAEASAEQKTQNAGDGGTISDDIFADLLSDMLSDGEAEAQPKAGQTASAARNSAADEGQSASYAANPEELSPEADNSAAQEAAAAEPAFADAGNLSEGSAYETVQPDAAPSEPVAEKMTGDASAEELQATFEDEDGAAQSSASQERDAGDAAFDELFAAFDPKAEAVEETDMQPVPAAEEKPEKPAEQEITPEDAILMSALGYAEGDTVPETETGTKTGTSSGKMYSDLDNAFAYRGQEYKNRDQSAAVASAYRDDLRDIFIRLVGTGIFTVLLFIYDVFGKKFGGALSAENYPVVNILISMQLLLITAAFSWRKLLYGATRMFMKRPVAYSVTATVVAATVLYDAVIAISAPKAFTLYNFPAALGLLMAVIGDFITIVREMETFGRLASFDSVCTLERINGQDDGKPAQYRLIRGSFASNYFRRTNRCGFPVQYFYLILFVIALGIILFLISIAASRTFAECANIFIAYIQFSLPCFISVSSVLPFFIFTRRGLDGSAVIFHEADTHELAEAGTVVLGEKDVFDENSIKIAGVASCSESGPDYFDAIAATSAIFNTTGGTIASAFKAVNDELGALPEVSNLRVLEGGAEADVGGFHYVIGTADTLRRFRMNVPDNGDAAYLSATRGGLVLYIAADGQPLLKLNMQYILDGSVINLIAGLCERDVRVVLDVTDPFITTELLTDLTGRTDFKTYVLRSGSEETGKGEDGSIDAGLIADGSDWVSAIRAADACQRYNRWTKYAFYINVVLIAVGLMVSVFLGALGASAGMSSLYVVLYQLIATLPSFIGTKLIFG